jgi:hypothetical protein
MHLLFKMGGLLPHVDAHDVRVIRHKPDGETEEFKTDAREILESGGPEKDFPLRHGDRVVIQPQLLAIWTGRCRTSPRTHVPGRPRTAFGKMVAEGVRLMMTRLLKEKIRISKWTWLLVSSLVFVFLARTILWQDAAL